jgi:hypothetical protein
MRYVTRTGKQIRQRNSKPLSKLRQRGQRDIELPARDAADVSVIAVLTPVYRQTVLWSNLDRES